MLTIGKSRDMIENIGVDFLLIYKERYI